MTCLFYLQVNLSVSVKMDTPKSFVNANIKYGGNQLFKLEAKGEQKPEGGIVTIDVKTQAPLKVIDGKFSGEVSVNDVSGSASMKFIYNAFNVEAKATRATVGTNEKKLSFEVSGSHVPTSKLNIEYSAARITDLKLEVTFDVDGYLSASWNCGIDGRKITCRAEFKGKSSKPKLRIFKRELVFDATLDLKTSKFQTKMSSKKEGQNWKDIKLMVKFSKTDNKLTMKFSSPFSKLKNVELDGVKESTSNGHKFVGTAKINNKPATIEMDYSLKVDTPVKEFEATLKGTKGNKYVNVAYKSKVDMEEKEAKGSLVVTSSEFKETSIVFEAEYGRLFFGYLS